MSNQTGDAHYLVRRGNINYKVLGSDISSDCQSGDLFLVNRPTGSGTGPYYKIDYDDMVTKYPSSFSDTHGYSNTTYPICGMDFDPVNNMWMLGGGNISLLFSGDRFLKVTSSLSSSNLDIPSASSSDWTDLTSTFPWDTNYGLMPYNPIQHTNDGTNSYWIVHDYYRKFKYSTETTTLGLSNSSNWNSINTLSGRIWNSNTTGIPFHASLLKYFDGKWIASGREFDHGGSGIMAVDTSINFNTSNVEYFYPIFTTTEVMYDMIKDSYNNLYIACGGGGYIITAPTSDITNWTIRGANDSLGGNLGTDPFWSIATDGEGTTLAAGGYKMDGGNNGNFGKIAKSTDGINWSLISDSVIGGMEWIFDIEYYGKTWVACGRSKTDNFNVIYSTDGGSNWTKLEADFYSGPGSTSYPTRATMAVVKNVGGNWYVVGQRTQNKAAIGSIFGFQNTDLFISNLTDAGITTTYKVTGSGFTSLL